MTLDSIEVWRLALVDSVQHWVISIRTLLLAIVLSLCVTSPQASVAQDSTGANANTKDGVNAKAGDTKVSPFVGFFKNDSISLSVRAVDGKFVGEMRMAGKATPFTATADGRKLTGVFVRRGTEFKFVAELTGDSLSFELGLQSHQLKRSFDTTKFLGFFAAGKESFSVREAGGDFFGEFKSGDELFKFKAKIVIGKLKGTVAAQGVPRPFVAIVTGRAMTLKVGEETFNLKRLGASHGGTNTIRTTKKEVVLVEIDGVVDTSVMVGPRNKRIGFVVIRGGKRLPVIDGVVKELKHHTVGMMFSGDGKRVGILTRDADGWRMIVDDQATPPYEQIGRGRQFFSYDSKRWAMAGKRDGKWFLIVNGKETGEPFDEIRGIEFSPDSKRISFLGRRNRHWFAVVDGLPSSPLEGIAFGAVVFSPDSKQTAYVMTRGTKQVLVAGGKESPPCDAITRFVFNPSSNAIAYVKVNDRKHIAVVDEGASKPFDLISNFMFSPDGKRYALTARLNGKYLPIVDGAVLGDANGYEMASVPTFSPDSKRVAFISVKDGEMSVVEEGVAGPAYKQIGRLTFSPNSRSIAYVVRTEQNQWRYVVGQQPGPAFSKMPAPIVFSPTGRHFAYIGEREGASLLCVDGDGGRLIQTPARGSLLQFKDASGLHIVNRQGNKFVRLELSLSE